MRNQKGWIRILEVVISILVITTFLLYFAVQYNTKNVIDDEEKYDLILNNLLTNMQDGDLRYKILNLTEENNNDINYVFINNYIQDNLPSSYSYAIRFCNLGDSEDHCKMSTYDYARSAGKSVYADTIILTVGPSITEDVLTSKKVMLYLWMN